MLFGMHMMLDALQRAIADCFKVRVIGWTLFPLVLVVAVAAVLAAAGWDHAVHVLKAWLEHVSWLRWLWAWAGTGASAVTAIFAAVLVILMFSPVLIMLALLVVAIVMTPQMVDWVAHQRFMHLERKQAAGWVASAWWAMGSSLMAALMLVITAPLVLLMPPLILVVPPLIGGWLTYRVITFDALAEHASKAERQLIFRQHRYRLMAMGLLCGYMGTAPSIVWASGVIFAAAFWVLIPVALWIYALVVAFSSLWFAHYALAALYSLRASELQQAKTLHQSHAKNGGSDL